MCFSLKFGSTGFWSGANIWRIHDFDQNLSVAWCCKKFLIFEFDAHFELILDLLFGDISLK